MSISCFTFFNNENHPKPKTPPEKCITITKSATKKCISNTKSATKKCNAASILYPNQLRFPVITVFIQKSVVRIVDDFAVDGAQNAVA